MRTRVIVLLASVAALVAAGTAALNFWNERQREAKRVEAAFEAADRALEASGAGDVEAPGYLADAARRLADLRGVERGSDLEERLARVYAASGRWRDAADVLERLHWDSPRDAVLAERTADAFQKAWRLRRTDDLYRRCLRAFSEWKALVPTDPRPVLGLAAVRVEAWTRLQAYDQKPQALAGLQAVVDRWPGTPEAQQAAEVQDQLKAAGMMP